MKILNGLAPIADDYDHYIFDIWGVLHNGVRLYNGTIPCLEELKARGKQVLLLSNSPERSERVSEQLDYMGLGRHLYDHIITSGESSYHSLEQYTGQSIYCFEDHDEPQGLGELNLKQVSSPNEADIAIMYDLRHNDVEPYREPLSQCLDQGLKVICANPDRIVDVGGQMVMCAGTLADLYEDMGGQVEWHGKPHSPVYEWAYELLGRPDKSKILAIGDSIRTDDFHIHACKHILKFRDLPLVMGCKNDLIWKINY